jgi:hypothetical protein
LQGLSQSANHSDSPSLKNFFFSFFVRASGFKTLKAFFKNI